jgi:hypothetical protein
VVFLSKKKKRRETDDFPKHNGTCPSGTLNEDLAVGKEIEELLAYVSKHRLWLLHPSRPCNPSLDT